MSQMQAMHAQSVAAIAAAQADAAASRRVAEEALAVADAARRELASVRAAAAIAAATAAGAGGAGGEGGDGAGALSLARRLREAQHTLADVQVRAPCGAVGAGRATDGAPSARV